MSWPVEELIGRAVQALAGGAAPSVAGGEARTANGRVTQLPDRRLVRWYATIGLVDPPLASQGRTARYGPRHLLQLVAVKRRQAQGRTLAQIQAELAGATDAALAAIADVSADLLSDSAAPVFPAPEAAAKPAAARFWAARPVAVVTPQETDDGTDQMSTVDLYGVRLGEALLLLPEAPDHNDLAAIRAAAQPLLDLLVHRGLLPHRGGSTT
jgi:DNA-binding transcriptional MerR regulator